MHTPTPHLAVDRRVMDWLLDADPALIWQVERDLAASLPPDRRDTADWRATRARVAQEGWGAALLARQDPDGQWAGGAHFPAGFFDAPEGTPQPFTATSWSLKSLREWGVPATALGDTAARLATHARWEYDDLPFWGGEVDACINAYTLASGAWLGVDVAPLVAWFREQHLPDGGWNCYAIEHGATRSSFHSTLSVITELLTYEQLTGDDSVAPLRHRGEDYLLQRGLMHRLSTGEVVGDFVTDFIAPRRHQYSALAALDHFRAASLHDHTTPDPRLAEAVDVVVHRRQPDGRWLQGNALPGVVWFAVDAAPREPSRWVTLQALRVLDWWGAGQNGRP
ncbi:MAG: squalene cyclase [Micrococcus sp.]|nr:squalene cyclase [Micrococcus sp.]